MTIEKTDIERVKECLAYIAANPAEATKNGTWTREVMAEAITLGLAKPPCNPRPVDQKAAYYEGLILARQERDGIYD